MMNAKELELKLSDALQREDILKEKLAESKREFRAADATIENLQMQVEKLAAENAGLKSVFVLEEIPEEAVDALQDTAEYDWDSNDTGSWQWIENDTDVIRAVLDALKPETPATDAFLAEVRASAITDALESLDGVFDTDCVMESNGISYEDAEQRTAGAYAVSKAIEEFADKLRKGVQS